MSVRTKRGTRPARRALRVCALLAVGVASYLLGASPAAGSHIAGAHYFGTVKNSDPIYGTVEFTVTPDGSVVDQLHVKGLNTGPGSCSFDTTFGSTLPIVNHGFSSSDPGLSISGFFYLSQGSYGIASVKGTVSHSCVGTFNWDGMCDPFSACFLPAPPLLTPTGQRTKALKRCLMKEKKHDWPPKKLKKCRKRAKKLP